MMTTLQRIAKRALFPKPDEYGIRRYTYLDGLLDAFRQFESFHWYDRLVIPWTLIRWLFWLIVTCILGNYRRLKFRGDEWLSVEAFMWGRHDSPEPVVCRCLWAGPRRACFHGYGACGDDDVEPEDYCRRCDGEIE